MYKFSMIAVTEMRPSPNAFGTYINHASIRYYIDADTVRENEDSRIPREIPFFWARVFLKNILSR